MGNFNRDRGDRGSGNRPGATMHQAVCSQCNKGCEVPFRPTGDRPVYCKDCFAGKGGGEGRFHDDRFSQKQFGDRSGSKLRFDNNQQPKATTIGGDDAKRLLESVNSKLERLVRAVENMSRSDISQAVLTGVLVKPTEGSAKTEESSVSTKKEIKESKRIPVKKAKK